MKILRAVTRRGFKVGMAGYFTVLKPNIWFPASRLPDNSHNFIVPSDATLEQERKTFAHSNWQQKPTVHLDLAEQGVPDRRSMRFVLIVVVATAITCFLLWWLFFRPHTVS